MQKNIINSITYPTKIVLSFILASLLFFSINTSSAQAVNARVTSMNGAYHTYQPNGYRGDAIIQVKSYIKCNKAGIIKIKIQINGGNSANKKLIRESFTLNCVQVVKTIIDRRGNAKTVISGEAILAKTFTNEIPATSIKIISGGRNWKLRYTNAMLDV